jgi:hypothetical protein
VEKATKRRKKPTDLIFIQIFEKKVANRWKKPDFSQNAENIANLPNKL